MSNRASDDGTVSPDPKVRVLAGVCLIVLAMAVAALALWSLITVHDEYRQSLAQEAPVLTHHPGISFFYLGLLGLGGMLLFGCCGVVHGIRQSRGEPAEQRCMRVASSLVVIGVVAMFPGRYVANWYWSETFRDAGYVSCAHSFSITKKWDNKVWVQDRAFCTDDEVLRLFASYKHDLSDVNEYLRNKKKD